MPAHSDADVRRLRRVHQKFGPLIISTNVPVLPGVRSDEPNSPSSSVERSSIVPQTAIAEGPIDVLVNHESGSEGIPEIAALVTVLLTSIESVLQSIFHREFLLRQCIVHTQIRDTIVHRSYELRDHVAGMAAGDIPCVRENAQEIKGLIRGIVGHLLILHRKVEEFHRVDMKPLPALPIEEAEESNPPQAEASSPVAHSPIVDSPVSDSQSRTTEADSTLGTTDTTPESSTTTVSAVVSSESKSPLVKPRTRRRDKLLQRLLQLREDFLKSFRADSEALASSLEERKATARQSFINDRVDPGGNGETVDMPLPTGAAVAICFDQNGDVRAASLTALVHILTSHHVFTMDEVSETFFLAFRLFSSPQAVLEAVQERWDEQPPLPLDQLSLPQQRVWLQQKTYVANCIAQLILTWLDDYWRPKYDKHMLPQLSEFVKGKFPAAGIPAPVLGLLQDALHRASQPDYNPRRQRTFDTERDGPPPPPPDFFLLVTPDDDFGVSLSCFDAPGGSEQLAVELTHKAHGLFRAIDIEPTVFKWVKNRRDEQLQLIVMEETILVWVANSILTLANRTARVQRIEFWLDVAAVKLFWLAQLLHCICDIRWLGSVAGGAIERDNSGKFSSPSLSSIQSYLAQNLSIKSKEQYRLLSSMYDKNFAAYRRELSKSTDCKLPVVPLISTALRQDVISAYELSDLTNEAEKELIHFSAFKILRRTIRSMEASMLPYNIQPLQTVQTFIQQQLDGYRSHDAFLNTFDAMSLQLEGRAPAPIQKGRAWLQTIKGSPESGQFALFELPDPRTASPPSFMQKFAAFLNLRRSG
ncbi:unnamed protein product [Mycena citricolor]|uniref:Uncharacterized protein n=1 Tax=Mycena citricolor TaxID=2018698 RepID=A0AAD2HZG9_9AGAR|nr:unnamed protein product [Mycena citricolor]